MPKKSTSKPLAPSPAERILQTHDAAIERETEKAAEAQKLEAELQELADAFQVLRGELQHDKEKLIALFGDRLVTLAAFLARKGYMDWILEKQPANHYEEYAFQMLIAARGDKKKELKRLVIDASNRPQMLGYVRSLISIEWLAYLRSKLLPQVAVPAKEEPAPAVPVNQPHVEQVQAVEKEKIKWSEPDSPSRWAKTFNCTLPTMVKRLKEQIVRNKKLSERSYQIAIDDLPADYEKHGRPRK